MVTQPDYYDILQVHPRAEKEVIDAVYRRLASKYHPGVSYVSNAVEIPCQKKPCIYGNSAQALIPLDID